MSEEQSPRLSRNELDIIAKTISDPLQEGTFALATVGIIRSEDQSGIQDGAGLLLNMDGIETVLVCGIVDGTELVGYLITRSATVEPKKWLEELFPSQTSIEFDEENLKEARFGITLGILGSCKDRAALWSLTKNLLTERFLSKIGKVVN